MTKRKFKWNRNSFIARAKKYGTLISGLWKKYRENQNVPYKPRRVQKNELSQNSFNSYKNYEVICVIYNELTEGSM